MRRRRRRRKRGRRGGGSGVGEGGFWVYCGWMDGVGAGGIGKRKRRRNGGREEGKLSYYIKVLLYV